MRNFKGEAIYHMFFSTHQPISFPFEICVSTISSWGGWQ